MDNKKAAVSGSWRSSGSATRPFAGPRLSRHQTKGRRDFPAILGEGSCKHQTAGANGDRDTDRAANDTIHDMSPVGFSMRTELPSISQVQHS
jgi:hypothetical protein